MASASGRRNTKPPGHLDDYIVQSVGVNSVESVGPRIAAAAAAAVVVNNHTIDGNNVLVNNFITTNEQGKADILTNSDKTACITSGDHGNYSNNTEVPGTMVTGSEAQPPLAATHQNKPPLNGD